ncbi:MAG: filamentous hemagglutinin N-terminal domain-containing protein [Leptolyngbyaceae cyanobacterium bins.349]|nr:filamentous hemagglutinin N-terminal domain-containing protein [Leptolyngbyaceae cyanobacterium bins.349]
MADGCSQVGSNIFAITSIAVGAIALLSLPTAAQLTPDTTLGVEPSTVGPEQLIQGIPSNVIDGGATRGINLFHSFQDFNVEAGRGVYFANPATIANIFTRVTGGNPSNILGRLGVLGTANLFLLNPSGIVFGPGATLDVQGSFYASTASAIQFGNGEVFSAIAPFNVPLITVQPNATFLNALAAVSNAGTLQAGQNLSINGTAITNTGTLQAGQILDLTSDTAIINTGFLQAGQNVGLNSTTAITNTGFLQAGQDVALTSTNFTNTNTIQAGANVTVTSTAVTNAGTLQADANLTLTSGTVDNTGILQSGADLTVTSGAVSNAGTLQAGTNLIVTSVDVTNAGTLGAGQDLTLQANQIGSTGTLLAPNGTLIANALAGDLTLQQGTAQTAVLSASNLVSLPSSQITVAGNLFVSGNEVSITDTLAAPSAIAVGGNLLLSGQTATIAPFNNPASLIQTTGDLNLILQNRLTTSGNFSTGGSATLQAPTLEIANSQFLTTGNHTLQGNTVTVTGTQLTVGGDLVMDAQTALVVADAIAAPTVATAGGNVVLQGNQSVTLQLTQPTSLIQSAGSLTVSSGVAIAASGRLNSNGNTLIATPGNVQLANSQLSSNTGSVNVSAGGNGILQDTQIQAAADVFLFAQGLLQLQDSITNPLLVSAGGNLTLQGNDGIQIQALNNPLSLLQSAGNLGMISANGAVLSNIGLNVGGQFAIAAANNITLGDYSGPSLQLVTSNGAITVGTIDTSSATGNGGPVLLVGDRGVSAIAINTFSTALAGNGGAVTVQAPNGNVSLGAIDTTSVEASGGAVTVGAGGAIAVGAINSFAGGVGAGGAVSLVSNQDVTTNANIDTSAIDGNAGTVTLISRQGSINTSASTLFANGLGAGNGSNVSFQAAREATVGSIFTDGGTAGRGGNMTIQAGGTVAIAPNQTLNSTTFGTGPAGDLTLSGQSIVFNSNAQLIAGSNASGNAGNISVQAADASGIWAEPGSLFDASVAGPGASGSAGAITLRGGFLTLTGTDLYTDVINGDGIGGAVRLTATTGDLTFTNSVIYADTIGAGAAGSVALMAPNGGIATTTSTILASTQGAGLAGTIRLTGRSITSVGSTFDVAAFGTGATGKVAIAALDNGSVFLSGGEIFADTFEANLGNSGNVTIRGGNVTLDALVLDATNRGTVSGSSILVEANNQIALENGSALITIVDPNATGPGGNVTLRSNAITLSGNSRIDASTNGWGAGGTIQLQTPDLRLTEQSEINAKTTATGQAGSIAIAAAGGTLRVENDSRISAAVEATGTGGAIEVNVGRLELQSGGQLLSSTSGSGTAGSITVAATEAVTVTGRGTNPSGLFAQSSGAGQAGDLAIATPQLRVDNGAEVSVTTSGSGTGGRLTITTDQLQVTNNSEISASTDGSGAGGVLTIQANQSVELATGGRLAARSTGSGTAGSLTVTTNQLSIRTGAELSTSSTGTGNAGQIKLTANSLSVTDGGKITSRSTGSGNAGSITATVRDRFRMSAGEISAASEQGGGGQIAIAARDILLDRSSLISSSVSDGNGGGGNITLRARNSFYAFEDSDILANAQFGDGGTIVISSPLFIADIFATVGRNPGQNFSRFRGNGRVDISSSSVFGVSGTVQIPDISFIQNSLSPLEDEFAVSEQIVAGSCLARRVAGQSSFVITGTGGLARTPYNQAIDRYTLVGVQPAGPDQGTPSAPGQPGAISPYLDSSSTPYLAWKPGDAIQEAQGFIRTPDGRVVIGTHPQLATVAKAQDLVCGF